jgi:cytochrome c peroxidase
MKNKKSAAPRRAGLAFGLSMFGAAIGPTFAQTPRPASNFVLGQDGSGITGTINVNGPLATTGPFFQSLGTNGRSCATCHLTTQAMSFTPAHAQLRFALTRGSDPLFATVDGANCPEVVRSSPAGHSLVLRSGLIRIGLAVPANAQYSITAVHDPYGCALRIDPTTKVLTASVYRRPLPSTNLSFVSAVMWDARETLSPLSVGATDAANLNTDLSHQVVDAITTHAQGVVPPTTAQVQGIVSFELGLYSAQAWDYAAGLLNAGGAMGGPVALSRQLYYPGINDTLGQDPTGLAFTPVSMTLFATWSPSSTAGYFPSGNARAQIAAGEKLFDSAPMTISNVRGLNDNAALSKPTTFQGTCATCHDAPDVGDHSLPLPLDIGTGHSADSRFETDPVIAAAVNELSEPDLPVFLISGCPDPFNPGQPASFYTTDPGRALITGNCNDLNRVKGPILRGLAARAPYFHNGAAANLTEVVNFYNLRFQMNLTDVQKQQLVAFLNTL